MTLRISRFQNVATIAVSLAALTFGACHREPRKEPVVVTTAESPVAITEQWRAKHESDYRREWVSIAGLHKLNPGSNTAGSGAGNDIVLPAAAPARLGAFVRVDDSIRFEPAAGASVSLNGEPVTGAITLRDDRQPKADELVVGDIRLVVHVSGETRSLRVREMAPMW